MIYGNSKMEIGPLFQGPLVQMIHFFLESLETLPLMHILELENFKCVGKIIMDISGCMVALVLIHLEIHGDSMELIGPFGLDQQVQFTIIMETKRNFLLSITLELEIFQV